MRCSYSTSLCLDDCVCVCVMHLWWKITQRWTQWATHRYNVHAVNFYVSLRVDSGFRIWTWPRCLLLVALCSFLAPDSAAAFSSVVPKKNTLPRDSWAVMRGPLTVGGEPGEEGGGGGIDRRRDWHQQLIAGLKTTASLPDTHTHTHTHTRIHTCTHKRVWKEDKARGSQ